MASRINRREFLKLASLLSLSYTLSSINGNPEGLSHNSHSQNVFIIVFDALSASDIPFFGYPRNTMPFLSRFIEHATVYHNHYAGGNFTTPGTASLLTGTLPWTHRAFPHYGTVAKQLATHNIFNAMGKKEYYRFAYSHNAYAVRLLTQFIDDIEHHIPQQELFLDKDWIVNLFSNDYDIAVLSMLQILQTKKAVQKNSLFLPDLYNLIIGKHKERIQELICKTYGITKEELVKSKRGTFNEPRCVAIYLTRMIRSDGLIDICKDYNLKKYSSASSIVENVKKKLNQ